MGTNFENLPDLSLFDTDDAMTIEIYNYQIEDIGSICA
jgi:hypothetical protein